VTITEANGSRQVTGTWAIPVLVGGARCRIEVVTSTDGDHDAGAAPLRVSAHLFKKHGRVGTWILGLAQIATATVASVPSQSSAHQLPDSNRFDIEGQPVTGLTERS
jgi:hypothetical protein